MFGIPPERLSPECRKVIAAARRQSRHRLNATTAGDLLVALLRRRSTAVACQLLTQQWPAVDFDAIARLESSSAGAQRQGGDDEAQRVLRRAWDHARRMGHHFVGTEHLLMAILELGKTPGIRRLRSSGVTADRIRRALLEAYGRPTRRAAKASAAHAVLDRCSASDFPADVRDDPLLRLLLDCQEAFTDEAFLETDAVQQALNANPRSREEFRRALAAYFTELVVAVRKSGPRGLG